MNWKNKKVLVTGGAGFIGSHLTEMLVKLGARVTVADLFPKESYKNLKNVKNDILMVKCDLSDENEVKKIKKKHDYIFHLAAVANPTECEQNPQLAFKYNILSLLNILRLVQKQKIKKIIFTSSASLYGDPKYLPINEKHPLNYISTIYNLTKKAGEDLCILYYKKYKLPILYFRLVTTFGPRQKLGYFIPALITQALKGKTVKLWSNKPTRDFIFVEDTVRALIKGAEVNLYCDPINISCGKEFRIKDIAEYVASSFGVKVKFLNKEVIGPMRQRCDNFKAQRKLNWRPRVRFKEGLNKTIDWYKQKLRGII